MNQSSLVSRDQGHVRLKLDVSGLVEVSFSSPQHWHRVPFLVCDGISDKPDIVIVIFTAN